MLLGDMLQETNAGVASTSQEEVVICDVVNCYMSK